MSPQQNGAVASDSTYRRTMRNLRLLFAAMALIVIATTLITYFFGNRVIEMRNRGGLHRTVIAQCAQLLSTLTDAETGQRGFIITGDEKYLAPYENARQRLPQILEQLGRANVIAQQPQTLGAIENLANAKLNELAETIALRKEHGFDAATEVVRQGFGRETMEKLRDRNPSAPGSAGSGPGNGASRRRFRHAHTHDRFRSHRTGESAFHWLGLSAHRARDHDARSGPGRSRTATDRSSAPERSARRYAREHRRLRHRHRHARPHYVHERRRGRTHRLEFQ